MVLCEYEVSDVKNIILKKESKYVNIFNGIQ